MVIVIAPLVALMDDQVDGFVSRGLKAVRVGSCPSKDLQVINGEYQLVFVSPEAILTRRKWRKMLLSYVYQTNLVCLTIDEAHCVRTWHVYV